MNAFHYSVRKTLRSPLFSIMAVLTLAIGIAAACILLSIARGVLAVPFVFPRAEELVLVGARTPASQPALVPSVSLALWRDWRDQSTSFAALATTRETTFTVSTPSGPIRVSGARVTPEFLAVFGLLPMAGRDFAAADALAGGDPVALVSPGFWQRQFGGDRAVVGTRLTIDGRGYTVIGVAPAGIEFPAGNLDVLVPLVPAPNELGYGFSFTRAIGRLKPGVGLERARQELTAVHRRLAAQNPDGVGGYEPDLGSYVEQVVGGTRTALKMLSLGVVCLVLIAASNIAGLMQARGLERRGEFALRAALGGSVRALVRQLLVECALIATAGSVLGLLLAGGFLPVLVRLLGEKLPRAGNVQLDLAVGAAGVAVAFLATMGAGIFPALRGARVDPATALRDTTRGGTPSVAVRRMRQAIDTVQLALTVALVILAGLLAQSLHRLLAVDVGFEPERLVLFPVGLGNGGPLDLAKSRDYFDQMRARVAVIPGVETAALIHRPPMVGASTTQFPIPRDPAGKTAAADLRVVSPGLFSTMRIPLLCGREFSSGDRLDTPPVVIVNRALAERYLGGVEAAGRELMLGAFGAARKGFTVVGVVANVRMESPDAEIRPAIYYPYGQVPEPTYFRLSMLVVRVGRPENVPANEVRRAIQEIDPTQSPGAPRAMSAIVRTTVQSRQVYSTLIVAFAVAAVGLAGVSIFSVASQAVLSRRRDIAIRRALGAPRADVLRLIARESLRPVAWAVLIGAGLAWAGSRTFEAMLYQVRGTDPLTYALLGAGFLAFAVVAVLLPARRALSIDPALVLKGE